MRVGKAGGKEWLRLGEAADALGVSLNTLRRWTDSGRLTCYRSPGGHRRYRRSHVEALLSLQYGAQGVPSPRDLTRHAIEPAANDSLHTSMTMLAAVAADGLGVTSCIIALHTADKTMRIVAQYSRSGSVRRAELGTTVPLERAPIASEVLRTGRRLVIADLSTTKLLTHGEAEIYRSRGDAAVLAIPVLVASRAAGVIELADTRSPRSFTGANITFAEFIAGQATRLIGGQIGAEHDAAIVTDGLTVAAASPRPAAAAFRAAGGSTVQALVDTLCAKLGAAGVRALGCLPEHGAFALVAAAAPPGAAPLPASPLPLVDDHPRGERHEMHRSGSILRVPVRLDGALVGRLEVILARPEGVLSPEQLTLVEATATVMGLALGGAREEPDALPQATLPDHPVSASAADLPSPAGAADGSLDAALSALRRQPGLDVCSLYRVAGDAAVLVARAADQPPRLPDSWPLADSPTARLALASRATVVVARSAGPAGAPKAARRFLEARGLAGALLAPLIFEDRLLGFLEAGSRRTADLRAAVPIVEIAAGLLAAALATHDSVARLQRHARDLELVVEADLEDTARLSTGEVLHTVAERLATLSHSPVVDIFAVEGDTLRALVSYDGDRFDRAWEGVVIPLLRYPCAVRAVDTGEVSIVASLDDPSLSEEGRYSLEKWGYQGQLSLPLIWGGRVIGLAQLSDYVPRDFRPDLELVRGLGRVAARALQNVILFAQAERHSRALNELVGLGDLSSRMRDLDALVRRVAERLQAAVDVANCDIYKMCADGLRCVASYDRSGHDERLVGNLLDPLSYPTVIAAMNSRKILVVTAPDDPQLSEEERRTYREFGFASEVCIPLIVNDELYGAVDIYDTRERDYAEFLGFFESAGRLLAGACENALLFDRLQQRTRALHEIVELAAAAFQTRDPQELLQVIAERLRATTEAAGCDIFALQGEQLRCMVSVNGQGVDPAGIDTMPAMSRLPATIMTLPSAETLAIAGPDDPRLSTDERDEMRARGCLSRLCIPLLAGERAVGLIDLFDTRPRDYAEYLDFTESVGRMIAGAIENARLVSELANGNRVPREATRA